MAHASETKAQQERAHREDRERLLAMLGHELKTPLATMRMLLIDQAVPAETARRITASVTEMAQMLDRTIQSDQLEAGQLDLHVQSCRLFLLIESVCRELPGSERVVMDIVGGFDHWIRTDEHLLKVVIRNLLDNALKYSPSDSPVRLKLDSDDMVQGHWRMTVRNIVGRAGVPDPERVFQKYYRNPKAGHRSGSGLGLYLISGLVGALGGQLRYAHEQAQVCFVLSMPIVKSGEQE